MTMTDTILFVKETHTCHYVIHIATPRLCGEPGFRSRLDSREEAQIRCREILNEEAYQAVDRNVPSADHPLKMHQKAKPGIVAPPRKEKDSTQQQQQPPSAKNLKSQHDLIRKALERLLEKGGLASGEVIIESLDGDDGVIVEYIETDLELDPDETPTTYDDEEEEEGSDSGSRRGDANRGKSPSLDDVLRAAGYNVKNEKARAGGGSRLKGGAGELSNSKSKSDEEEDGDSAGRRRAVDRDEL